MPTFQKHVPEILSPGIYVLQVTDCVEETSRNGNPMFHLKLRVLPGTSNWLHDYLVFIPESRQKLTGFCDSAGLELPSGEGIDIAIYPMDCLVRVCYAKLVEEEGTDGKVRLKVAYYMTRTEALKKASELASVPLPPHAPGPKKLGTSSLRARLKTTQTENNEPASTLATSATPVAADNQNSSTGVDPDDIPF
jgi:hypothetical protein